MSHLIPSFGLLFRALRISAGKLGRTFAIYAASVSPDVARVALEPREPKRVGWASFSPRCEGIPPKARNFWKVRHGPPIGCVKRKVGTVDESRNGSEGTVGVVLFQLGGPDSTLAIEPFLFNLFSDPDIDRKSVV